MKTKVCTKCGEEKPLTEFYRDRQKSDGLSSSCKICAQAKKKEYYEANQEKVKASVAAYREANQEKVKAKNAAYREANKEKVKAQKAAFHEANPEKVKAHSDAYYKANKEKIAARRAECRAYQKEMREMQEEAGFEISDLNQGEQC